MLYTLGLPRPYTCPFLSAAAQQTSRVCFPATCVFCLHTYTSTCTSGVCTCTCTCKGVAFGARLYAGIFACLLSLAFQVVLKVLKFSSTRNRKDRAHEWTDSNEFFEGTENFWIFVYGVL